MRLTHAARAVLAAVLLFPAGPARAAPEPTEVAQEDLTRFSLQELRAAQEELELKVKAAFLFNFAKFTTWPASKVKSPTDTLYLCVQGKAPIARVLQETVYGRAIGGHAIDVLQAPRAEALRQCHIVYVSASGDGAIAAELGALAGHGVLTVHEAAEARPGGVVRFFLSDAGRVRFEVNVTAAAREQLTLSSKLLEVSQVVNR